MHDVAPEPREITDNHLSNEYKADKKNYKKLIIGIVAILILIIGGFGGFYLIRAKNPIPENIRKEANFILYYPNELPGGYKLDKSSVKYDNGVVFYSLTKSSSSLLISEQSVPSNPPDLDHLMGFNKITTFAGNVALGSVNNQPTAILLTDSTLLTITGTGKNSTKDTVSQTIQNMKKLN